MQISIFGNFKILRFETSRKLKKRLNSTRKHFFRVEEDGKLNGATVGDLKKRLRSQIVLDYRE